MNFPKVFAATALVGLTGLPAVADTLILNDGSRLRGTLVSMNRQTVVFDEDRSAGNNQRARTRRVRVPLDRVDAIDFTDQGDYGTDRNDDSWSNDPWSNNDSRTDSRTNDSRSNNDDYYGNNSSYGNNTNLRQRAVLVNADRQWTDTGITVRAGDVIRFDPTGVIEWGPGRQDGPGGEVNSPYNRNRPMANQPGGALIGRIGTGSGDMFFIGADRGTFRARTAGRLYLGVNDDHLQDNSGTFRVVIDHQ